MDEIRNSIKITAADCQSASKALAVIDPFISYKNIGDLQGDSYTPGIVSIITDKLCRYAIICLRRIWDERRGVASLKNILGKMKREPSLSQEELQTLVDMYKDLCLMGKRVRNFSGDYLAHSSGKPQIESSSFTPQELADFHRQTCKLVDAIYELVNGKPSGLQGAFEVWCGDALRDWAELLGRDDLTELA